MSVMPDDVLKIQLRLQGTVWSQVVTNTNLSNQLYVDYKIDLHDQHQSVAEFYVEEYGAVPKGDILFGATTLTFASPDERQACAVDTRGPRDYVSVPILSSDKKQCYIELMVLRGKGAPQTLPYNGSATP